VESDTGSSAHADYVASLQRADLVRALNQIEAAEESDAVAQALTAARDHLGMDVAYITTMDGRHQTIDAVVGGIEGVPLIQGAAIPIEQTYCMRMLNGDAPNLIPDTRAEPAVRDLEATRRIGAYLGVPVKLADGRFHGTLCCVSERARADLGDEELRFIQVLADIVAARVERAEGDLARLTASLDDAT
jgi:GAF domain-containing protein